MLLLTCRKRLILTRLRLQMHKHSHFIVKQKDEELNIFITFVYKHVNIPILNILKTDRE